MKLENQWRQKTLENLEKDVWSYPDFNSHLVTRCYELRKIPLDTFTNEDLRLMIGQNIGLNYLIPLALEVLTINLFAEGDLYEGDLLKSVLAVNPAFWMQNENYWTELQNIIKEKHDEIVTRNFVTAL